jgi:thiamine-phosphate diphosphorylase/hydroxyethylthiazole kinase
VQYRDKSSDTGVLVETARKLHNLCQSYGVPLLINDRVDVAVAVGAEGVHLGQDDMSWSFRSYYFLGEPNSRSRIRGS